LTSSARPPSGWLPFPLDFHPWSCSHPRGPRPSPCPCLRSGPKTGPADRTTSREVCRPFNAPNPESPRPGPRCPARPLRTAPSFARLVAGFHTRFVPPAPFLTTLTVCASPSPVVCFDHSRSWGLAAPGPARMNSGGGWMLQGVGLPDELPVWSVRLGVCVVLPPRRSRAVAPVPSARRSVGPPWSEDLGVSPVRLRLPSREELLPLPRRPRRSR